jgi:DNA-binding protein HU-beta
MTKAELVNTISSKLGIEKNDTQKVIEAFMQEIRTSMYNGDNVYLRGFGSFVIKTRAAKTGRNISYGRIIIQCRNRRSFTLLERFRLLFTSD